MCKSLKFPVNFRLNYLLIFFCCIKILLEFTENFGGGKFFKVRDVLFEVVGIIFVRVIFLKYVKKLQFADCLPLLTRVLN